MEIKKGDSVRFYDCYQANKDKDYSGTNPKHFPIGKVIKVYNYTSTYGYTDRCCDIKIGDRISKAHFVSMVEKVCFIN